MQEIKQARQIYKLNQLSFAQLKILCPELLPKDRILYANNYVGYTNTTVNSVNNEIKIKPLMFDPKIAPLNYLKMGNLFIDADWFNPSDLPYETVTTVTKITNEKNQFEDY